MGTASTNTETPIDRIDLGGWLLLLLGGVIVFATVIAPADLELRRIEAQRDLLRSQADTLTAKRDNYHALIDELDRGNERVIQRLAWHQLNLKPVGSEVADGVTLIAAHQAASLDNWVAPDSAPLPASTLEIDYPDTYLMRLISGPPSPWVMAFGAWLMLCGVMLSPLRNHHYVEDDGESDDDDAEEPEIN